MSLMESRNVRLIFDNRSVGSVIDRIDKLCYYVKNLNNSP